MKMFAISYLKTRNINPFIVGDDGSGTDTGYVEAEGKDKIDAINTLLQYAYKNEVVVVGITKIKELKVI